MRPDFAMEEACPKEAVDDVIRRIKKSLQTVKSKEDEEKFYNFWKQFHTADFMPNPRHPLGKVCNTGEADVSLFALWCYWPVLNKGSSFKKFPHPAKYEVLIPYREQKQKGFVRYWIIPTGSGLGSKVIYLSHAFAIPERGVKVGKTNKGLQLNPFDSFPWNLLKPTFAEDDNRLNKFLKRFIDVPFTFEHGMAILEEEPVVRIPLYNIPLQLAYEMAKKDVGDAFAFDTVEALREKLKTANAVKLTREPINTELYCTLLLFSFWRQMNLTDQEEFDWLLKVMEQAGYPVTMKQAGWRKACDRLFASSPAESTP